MRYVKEPLPLLSELFPDSARSGSSANLIAGELTEARSRIPPVDLRDPEAVHWSLMWSGLEPLPRRTVRSLIAEHRTWVILPAAFAAWCGVCWLAAQLLG